MKTTHKPSFIFVKTKPGTLRKIDFEDIIFIEAAKDYCIIHLRMISGATRTIRILFTLGDLYKHLPANLFAQPSRSYIVNLNEFSSITEGKISYIFGRDTYTISIGGTYKEEFMKRINFVIGCKKDRTETYEFQDALATNA